VGTSISAPIAAWAKLSGISQTDVVLVPLEELVLRT
jgi:hypothetical protein